MQSYDPKRPFTTYNEFDEYIAADSKTATRYGKKVIAIELANIEYKFRYQKFRSTKKMKPPPSTGRIFSGFLVVRKVGTEEEYETWMPCHVFHELYKKQS
ncbi:MAG: hypothetical protein C9356_03010 [Oleiphilus sp.]|jgi:hypothetical protein|nr:MAG: hypothetical protein C9356_03010 [Oleiphilus sp.]